MHHNCVRVYLIQKQTDTKATQCMKYINNLARRRNRKITGEEPRGHKPVPPKGNPRAIRTYHSTACARTLPGEGGSAKQVGA